MLSSIMGGSGMLVNPGYAPQQPFAKPQPPAVYPQQPPLSSGYGMKPQPPAVYNPQPPLSSGYGMKPQPPAVYNPQPQLQGGPPPMQGWGRQGHGGLMRSILGMFGQGVPNA